VDTGAHLYFGFFYMVMNGCGKGGMMLIRLRFIVVYLFICFKYVEHQRVQQIEMGM
jgi:hypothetical protein